MSDIAKPDGEIRSRDEYQEVIFKYYTSCYLKFFKGGGVYTTVEFRSYLEAMHYALKFQELRPMLWVQTPETGFHVPYSEYEKYLKLYNDLTYPITRVRYKMPATWRRPYVKRQPKA